MAPVSACSGHNDFGGKWFPVGFLLSILVAKIMFPMCFVNVMKTHHPYHGTLGGRRTAAQGLV